MSERSVGSVTPDASGDRSRPRGGEKPDVLVLESQLPTCRHAQRLVLAIARTARRSGTLVLLITHRLAEVRARGRSGSLSAWRCVGSAHLPGDVTNDD